MDLSIEHIGLAARDSSALRNWYVRTLGAREIFSNGEAPPAFILEVSGKLWIEIYPANRAHAEAGDNKLAGWRHLALRVHSIQAARTELAGRGVVFEEPVKPAGGDGQVLFFKDCEGNLLHLVERTPESKALNAAP